MPHRRRRLVKAGDLAGIGFEQLPGACGSVGGIEPFERRIIVIAAELVPAVAALSDLETCIEDAVALQRAMDSRKNGRKFVARHVQETGAGPDGVIGLTVVKLIEPHGIDMPAETPRGDL